MPERENGGRSIPPGVVSPSPFTDFMGWTRQRSQLVSLFLVVMHQQSSRQLQSRVTSLPIADVLDAATRFFSRESGVYSAFLEKRGPSHVVLRGQGGEEIVIGAYLVPGGSSVSGSSYLFDQQIARFLDSLPVANVVPDAPLALPDAAETVTS